MKQIDRDRIERLALLAAASPRRRANDNLHPRLDDPIQRFLNGIEPGSYARPHRHDGPDRWEFFLALSGKAVLLLFDEAGRVLRRVELSDRGPTRGVEVDPGEWHTLAALERATVLLELKPGPYLPLSDKDFAAWAPAEGDPTSAVFERWFRQAPVGEGPERAGCAGGAS